MLHLLPFVKVCTFSWCVFGVDESLPPPPKKNKKKNKKNMCLQYTMPRRQQNPKKLFSTKIKVNSQGFDIDVM